MPRYFFHVDNGSARDGEGTELANVGAAKCAAVKLAGSLICDTAATFWETNEFAMTVTNDAGLTLFMLNFIGIESPAIQAHRPRIA